MIKNARPMAAARTRDAILNVAEVLFADRGFHGVSIREIAEAAGMRQSLVHYHFSNKETLYAAVYERRSLPINHSRSIMLQEIMENAGSGRPPLHAIVRALVGPSVLSSRDRASGGSTYARLITQLINDPQEHAVRISRTYNDPMARQVLDALRRAMPAADSVAMTWGYLFAMGAMTIAIAETGRARRLNADCNPNDVAATLELLTTFVEGGIRALSEEEASSAAPATVRKAARRPGGSRVKSPVAG